MRTVSTTALVASLLMGVAPARADLERVEIKSRRDVLNGQSLGSAGVYEAVAGTVHIVVEPGNPRDRFIPDLDRAPRDERGRVHASADFYLLKPKDAARGNHVLLLDIANRGSRIALRTLDRRNDAADGDDAELGDAFVLRQGFTVLWVGWQADLEPGPTVLRADVPRAAGVEGMMRGDFTLTRDAAQTAVAGAEFNAPLERQGADDLLLVRDDPYSPAQPVPRSSWRFSDDRRQLIVDGGLEAGKVYDLLYRTKDPFVAGLGFAAVRDAVAAARTGRFAGVNVTRTIAFGVSQSGRMLRDFLYQGFNADEHGGRVFDGFMIHIAGGARGSFTQRFAASGGDTYFYPVRFPFTPDDQTDPVTGERDGLLSRARADRVVPKIFFTNSAVEYWGGRGASLTHTTPDGRRDVAPGDDARIYFLARQQHGPAAFPPKRSAQEPPQQLPNPLDATWALRRLLLGMKDWIMSDVTPPRSRYPRIDDGTLVPVEKVRFPKAVGQAPHAIPGNVRLDMGPEFKARGISVLPARVGAPYVPLVPAVDADGNDITGVRMPDLTVPLATHTGWNFRDPSIGSPQSFVRLIGSYVPFALTRQERESSGDTRLSIQERYRDRDDYLAKTRGAAQALVADGFLVADDVHAIVERAAEQWAWLHASSPRTASVR
jgi:hypothetical protein